MSRLKIIIGIIVVIVLLGIAGFLGLHYYFSGGQLPLQPCENCHLSL